MPAGCNDLAALSPLDRLRRKNLEQLAREATAEEAGRGVVLSRTGDIDEMPLFLRAGRVRGVYPDGRQKHIDAATPQGRYAVGDLQPRRFTATVTG